MIENAVLRSNILQDEERKRTEFIRMVTAILGFKEQEERARQATARASWNEGRGRTRRGRVGPRPSSAAAT